MVRKHKDNESDDELLRLPVFAGCTARTKRRVVSLGTRLTIASGHYLTKAGSRGAEVLIVVSGHAVCLVAGVEEARFGPGDFFGEVATLDGGPRTATVVAETDMEVLVLNGPEFEMLCTSSPEVALRMLTVMAHRLRLANERAVA